MRCRLHGRTFGVRRQVPLVVQLMALDPFEEIEPVALVRPERVDAGGDERDVLLPVALDVRRVERLPGLRRDRPVERRQLVAIPRHHVHDDLDVARVHVGEHRPSDRA